MLKKSHYQRFNVWSADSGILCFKEKLSLFLLEIMD